MYAIFENRRSGGERRSGERRRGTRCPSCCNGSPADPARIPDSLERRSGTDRRRGARRIADGADLIPERYDYQWRKRWP